MCATGNGRVVGTADLTEHQLAEARKAGFLHVDEAGLGYVFLPWNFTTSKDRKREADYFSRIGAMI